MFLKEWEPAKVEEDVLYLDKMKEDFSVYASHAIYTMKPGSKLNAYTIYIRRDCLD